MLSYPGMPTSGRGAGQTQGEAGGRRSAVGFGGEAQGSRRSNLSREDEAIAASWMWFSTQLGAVQHLEPDPETRPQEEEIKLYSYFESIRSCVIYLT